MSLSLKHRLCNATSRGISHLLMGVSDGVFLTTLGSHRDHLDITYKVPGNGREFLIDCASHAALAKARVMLYREPDIIRQAMKIPQPSPMRDQKQASHA